MKPTIDWAELFRQFRSSQGITQNKLAEMLGYSLDMIRSIEQGKAQPAGNRQKEILERMGLK
jgi:transcriptional regulator with XRE-family HTH domain